jgi:hypothetical protein
MTDTTTPQTKRKTRVKARVGSGSLKNYVCITKGSEVKRTSRVLADTLVATEGWNYAPRKLWKEKVRDVKGYSAPIVVQVEVKKKAKKVKDDKPRKGKETKV